jgi:hypothetical protein
MPAALQTRRGPVRAMKRAVARHASAEAMIGLLQRSVTLGHKRLALLRCLQAEKMGLSVCPSLIAYCDAVAGAMAQSDLEQLASRVNAIPSGKEGGKHAE